MNEKEWRKTIKDRLVPECGYYYIVYDPDYVLGDETLYIQLKEKGFEILTYTDEIDFRLLFEEKIRSYTDRNVPKELIIVVNKGKADSYIPYDLAVTCAHISVDLAELIPSIDPGVLRDLPITLLDSLYNDESGHTHRRLSYDESRDLLLRKLYGLDPLLIRNEVQLLRFLLHLHYDRPDIPRSLLRFVSEQLEGRKEFDQWNIELMVHDRAAFFGFLEEHINRNDTSGLSLKHSEIKVYLDNVVHDGYIYVADGGAKFGISEKRERKPNEMSLKKRLEDLSTDIPATYVGWSTFMDTWASIMSSVYTEFHPSTSSELFTFLYRTKKAVNGRFEEWLEKFYGSLYNHPPSSPVMVHHMPRYISQRIEEGRKVALLVIDGLSVSQWKVIRAALGTPAEHGYTTEERTLFAWIPTLTSISRQALLSGKLPLSISRFLHGTHGEEKLWNNFWEDNDISSDKVGYKKLQGDSRDLNEITELIEENFQVAALILDKVDSIMHGQKQGSVMMHQEVRHWADTEVVSTLLDILFRHYDEVYLTSDHGNDEAIGIGSFSQGALIKEKGQRCRIYDTQQFRQEAQEVYPESIPWPQIGLPENYYPLLAPYGKAFTKVGTKVVTHGGASIDEVIVPFVRFTKEEKSYG